MLRKKRQIPLVLNYLQSLNCVRFLKKVISLVKQKIVAYPYRKRVEEGNWGEGGM
jgi:hypothetical protein